MDALHGGTRGVHAHHRPGAGRLHLSSTPIPTGARRTLGDRGRLALALRAWARLARRWSTSSGGTRCCCTSARRCFPTRRGDFPAARVGDIRVEELAPTEAGPTSRCTLYADGVVNGDPGSPCTAAGRNRALRRLPCWKHGMQVVASARTTAPPARAELIYDYGCVAHTSTGRRRRPEALLPKELGAVARE